MYLYGVVADLRSQSQGNNKATSYWHIATYHKISQTQRTWGFILVIVLTQLFNPGHSLALFSGAQTFLTTQNTGVIVTTKLDRYINQNF